MENTTANVTPEALRIMGHELNAHFDWVEASGDVCLAFLNSPLDESDIVLPEPPALQRLGLVKPRTVSQAHLWFEEEPTGLDVAPRRNHKQSRAANFHRDSASSIGGR